MDYENEDREENIKLAESIIEGEDRWMSELTVSANTWRNDRHRLQKRILSIQIINICLQLFATWHSWNGVLSGILIAFVFAVMWFGLKKYESFHNESMAFIDRAILRSMDRKESWENFLKEYRGY